MAQLPPASHCASRSQSLPSEMTGWGAALVPLRTFLATGSLVTLTPSFSRAVSWPFLRVTR